MDLVLTRTDWRRDGIFSILTTPGSKLSIIAITLEHSYYHVPTPKLPVGVYQCVRGEHRLHGMKNSFITFEIKNVPGHTNILFHWGNYNDDSDGCVLLGAKVITYDKVAGSRMITESKKTFTSFMELQVGVDTFTLTVEKT